MHKKLFTCCIVLLTVVFAQAQDVAVFTPASFVSDSDTLLYRILQPANYDPSKKYPLVVFLHGSGERGNDNEKQLTHGAKTFLRDDLRIAFPAIVIFPQCPADQSWANYKFNRDSTGKRSFELQPDQPATVPLQLVEKLIAQFRKKGGVDKNRIYIGGLSMGGMGTFEIVRRNPKLFAAAFPICGATSASIAKKVDKLSWWIFHGAKDEVVPPTSSIQIADALRKEGADVKFTLYPDAGHNSWDAAFAEKELFPWLFSRKK